MIRIKETRDGGTNPPRAPAPAARPRLGVRVSSLKLLGRRGDGCRCWILAVVVVDESPRDIESVCRVNQRYRAAINDHIDVVGLRINFQRLANVDLKRLEDFLLASIIRDLSVFTLTLEVFLHLIELVLFRLQSLGVGDARGFLDVVG